MLAKDKALGRGEKGQWKCDGSWLPGQEGVMLSPCGFEESLHGPHGWKGLPGGSVVRSLLPMQETWVRFLGQEDPLEKKMATYSSILAWEIPWIDKPDGLQSLRLQRVRHDLATKQQQHGGKRADPDP